MLIFVALSHVQMVQRPVYGDEPRGQAPAPRAPSPWGPSSEGPHPWVPSPRAPSPGVPPRATSLRIASSKVAPVGTPISQCSAKTTRSGGSFNNNLRCVVAARVTVNFCWDEWLRLDSSSLRFRL